MNQILVSGRKLVTQKQKINTSELLAQASSKINEKLPTTSD